jgi:hypothetical protein
MMLRYHSVRAVLQLFGRMGFCALMLGAITPLNAQFAPGLAGQNGLFAVPAATVGERGRFVGSITRTSALSSDSGNILSFNIGITPFRHVGLMAGIGFDSRLGVPAMHERMQFGARGVLWDYVQQRWWNVGADVDFMIDRVMDVTKQKQYLARARLVATLSPFRRFSMTGFAGYHAASNSASGVLSAQRTMTWGGGLAAHVFGPMCVMGEYSNGLELSDPTLTAAVGGIRIFPWSDVSITAGYGSSWRPGEAKQPILVFSLCQGTGALDFCGIDPSRSIVFTAAELDAPTTALSTGTADSSAGGLPVTLSAWTPQVQTDVRITRVLALARPRTGVPLFGVLDSTRFHSELLALNGDTTRVLQVTGTESASSEGGADRIAARVAILNEARSAGFPVSRVVFRDQYTPRRISDPIAYALFEIAKPGNGFKEMVAIDARDAASAVDSIASVVSGFPLYKRFHITVFSAKPGNLELHAVYAIQDALYSQSICKSYAVEIDFQTAFGDPVIKIEGAP